MRRHVAVSSTVKENANQGDISCSCLYVCTFSIYKVVLGFGL